MRNEMAPFFAWLLVSICWAQVSVAAPRIEALTEQMIAARVQVNLAQVELGKQLFFDRRLSGDGTMSCATCHIPEMLFTDGEAISLNYPTTKNWRNAPTLVNLAFTQFLFHDGRSVSLEDQALFPILSAFEMNQNLDYLEEEIRAVPAYRQEFAMAFGSDDVTRTRIGEAIAAFEKTLVSKNSPVDRFLLGESSALSPAARLGFSVFTGKGNCVHCHHGVNLNDDRFYSLKVPEDPELLTDPRVAATRRFVAKVNGFKEFRSLETDPGRFLITRRPEDWQAFKTPTLREIASTGPYMHNGIFATLEEVIEFFDTGGGPTNKFLFPLHLSTAEKEGLKAFLEGLSGEKIVFSFPNIP